MHVAARLCRRGCPGPCPPRQRQCGSRRRSAILCRLPPPRPARTSPKGPRGVLGKRMVAYGTRRFVSAKRRVRRADLPYGTWALQSLYFPSNTFPSPTGPGRSFLGPRRALPHPDRTCTSQSFLFPPGRLFPGCGLLTSAHGKAAPGQSRLTVSLLVLACDLGHCLLSPWVRRLSSMLPSDSRPGPRLQPHS